MLGSIKSFRKGLLGTAAIALMGVAGLAATPNTADAAAFAYSALTVRGMNLTISDSGGTALGGIGNVGGFTSFRFQLNGLQAQLGGTVLQSSDVGDTVPNINTSSGATLDMTQLCLADCTGYTDNVYVTDAGSGSAAANAPALTQTAVSDSNMLNTVLDGNATFGTQAGGRSNGGGTLASGSVLSGNSMDWRFTTGSLDGGKLLSLDWIEDRLVEVSTTRDNEFGTADLSFTIELVNRDGTQSDQILFDIDEGAEVIDIDSPDTDTALNDFGLSVSTTTSGVLLADTEYSLRFTFDSFASATSPIPEPGTLGLLGSGLLGLGALGLRRRRQRKA